ncbi:MAG: asparagine synthase-related protein [Gemmatimonadetes bacterium]|nr:asparagine synthase-related protein [Gemmatimonadota bacterium]
MYLCAFRPDVTPLDRADLTSHIARMRGCVGDVQLTAALSGPFAAVAEESREVTHPLLGRWNSLIGVGEVRLDNRAEVAACAGLSPYPSISDLEVALAAIDAHGDGIISRLIGDFAFVYWNPHAYKVVAVRDAFGIRPLFMRSTPNLLILSSRIATLGSEERIDHDYASRFLLGMSVPGSETIWSDVQAIPPGSCLVQRGTVRALRRHWNPADIQTEDQLDERTAVERFGALFEDAVRVRLADPASTWAQLSGGLDSSSVVAKAATLRHGESALAGTITLADTLTGGDERSWSDVIVRQFGVHNEQICDYWAWQNDFAGAPRTDAPTPLYPFFARDRRVLETIRSAGGRVLLSGFGSDHYLFGNLHYITDLAAKGRFNVAIRELLGWSIATRRSFWRMAGDYLVTPFLPAARASDPTDADRVPPWIDPVFARQHHVPQFLFGARMATVRPGSRFAVRTLADLDAVPAWVHRWPFDGAVDVRYPFLHRPLVEASLAMPATLRIRPGTHKWILREAMRGLLPEPVRTRVSKGSIDARVIWSLQRERLAIDRMLRDPILAQLGVVDAVALREAVGRARRGLDVQLVHLMSALALETWLAVRDGRWNSAVTTQSAA